MLVYPAGAKVPFPYGTATGAVGVGGATGVTAIGGGGVAGGGLVTTAGATGVRLELLPPNSAGD